jgi:crotonobetainyl-CoA:carnitine CoA-transferase CaiB-like acyl-CoA transferase
LRAVCTALGHEEWIERFPDNDARVTDRDRVHAVIAEAVRALPAAVVAERIAQAGGLSQRIRDVKEAWEDPLLADRGLVGRVVDPGLQSFPIPVSSLAGRGRTELNPAPGLGEHSREVAAEVGLADGEIERLIASGALLG